MFSLNGTGLRAEANRNNKQKRKNMINIKKGPGLSLGQVDKVAKPAASAGTIEAGQVVKLHATDGTAVLPSGASDTGLLGFAITDSTDGDAIESGKIGILLLDGTSVIETDRTGSTAITSTNFNVGANLTCTSAGNVALATASDRVIGKVEGIRSLPSIETVGGVKIQGTRAFLGIKLAAI